MKDELQKDKNMLNSLKKDKKRNKNVWFRST